MRNWLYEVSIPHGWATLHSAAVQCSSVYLYYIRPESIYMKGMSVRISRISNHTYTYMTWRWSSLDIIFVNPGYLGCLGHPRLIQPLFCFILLYCLFILIKEGMRQGRPTGIRITGSASSAPGAGFVRPPVCPTPPTISSSYGGASGGQLTDCWHQMSSCVQYILFLCCCIVCHMSSMSGLVGAV